MKEIMKVYGNWRCSVLVGMALVALLLAVAEADSMVALAGSKMLALAMVVLVALLGRKWMREGKIDEVKDVEE